MWQVNIYIYIYIYIYNLCVNAREYVNMYMSVSRQASQQGSCPQYELYANGWKNQLFISNHTVLYT